jgi:hypothetical protein
LSCRGRPQLLVIALMRRCTRILLNIATAGSLAFCIAASWLWMRSNDHRDTLIWDSAGKHYQLTSEFGGIIYVIPPWGEQSKPIRYGKGNVSQATLQGGWWSTSAGSFPSRGVLGFDARSFAGVPIYNTAYLPPEPFAVYRIPYWFLVVLTAAPIGAWVATKCRKRLRRHRRGLCATCGYDLRATPERCPECGAIPNPKDARLPGPGG